MSPSWLTERTILLTKHGSQAYGTNLPTSDTDVKGVAIPPAEYFFGYAHVFEQAESHNPDSVVYDIRKFFSLAAACNPNIIEVLWTDPVDHLVVTPLGRRLLEHRALFLSKKARHTFAGYAHAQLKRIKTHKRWLLSPPKEEPTREAFGLPAVAAADHEQIRAAEFLTEQGYGYGTNFQDLVDREKRYRHARTEWEQFENWKKTRNPARHALEAAHGYDTKHAMHLVRLLRMCREILTDGVVRVRRPDAEDLLAIRAGAWPYEALVEWAERQEVEIGALYDSSGLPHSPPLRELDALCVSIVGEALVYGVAVPSPPAPQKENDA